MFVLLRDVQDPFVGLKNWPTVHEQEILFILTRSEVNWMEHVL